MKKSSKKATKVKDPKEGTKVDKKEDMKAMNKMRFSKKK